MVRRFNDDHSINDFIDIKDNMIDLMGWSSDKRVIIKDWKFINYKHKWVHIDQITFSNCYFKDIEFIGGVPMDGCKFINCTFENCYLGEHIRWTKFDKCTFRYCIFGGYFHGSTVKSNCVIDKVAYEIYGDDSYILGKRTSCMTSDVLNKFTDEETSIELFKYFFDDIGEKFEIGKPYYYKYNNVWRKDIVKTRSYDLTHYFDIRICGKLHMEINECWTEEEFLNSRHANEKVINYTSMSKTEVIDKALSNFKL